MQGTSPVGAISRIPFFNFWGHFGPHPWANQGEIWQPITHLVTGVSSRVPTCTGREGDGWGTGQAQQAWIIHSRVPGGGHHLRGTAQERSSTYAVHLCMRLSVCVCPCVSPSLSVCVPVRLSVCVSLCFSLSLSVYLYVYLTPSVSVFKLPLLTYLLSAASSQTMSASFEPFEALWWVAISWLWSSWLSVIHYLCYVSQTPCTLCSIYCYTLYTVLRRNMCNLLLTTNLQSSLVIWLNFALF